MKLCFILLLCLPSFLLCCNELFEKESDQAIGGTERRIFGWGSNYFGGLGSGKKSTAFQKPVIETNYDKSIGTISKLFQTRYFSVLVGQSGEMLYKGYFLLEKNNTQKSPVYKKLQLGTEVPATILKICSFETRYDIIYSNGEVWNVDSSTVTKWKLENFDNNKIIDCTTGYKFSLYLTEDRKNIYMLGVLDAQRFYSRPTSRSNDWFDAFEDDEQITMLRSGALHALFLTFSETMSNTRVFRITQQRSFILVDFSSNSFASSIGASAFGSFVLFKNNSIAALGLNTVNAEFSSFLTPKSTLTLILQESILSTYKNPFFDFYVSPTSAFVITEERDVIGWGLNNFGQIVTASTMQKIYAPTLTDMGYPISQLSCNTITCIGLTKDNQVLSWGNVEKDVTATSEVSEVKLDEKPIAFMRSMYGTLGYIGYKKNLYLWGNILSYPTNSDTSTTIITSPTLFTSPKSDNKTINCGVDYLIYYNPTTKFLYGIGANYLFQLGDSLSPFKTSPSKIIVDPPFSSTHIQLIANEAATVVSLEYNTFLQAWGGGVRLTPQPLNITSMSSLKQYFIKIDLVYNQLISGLVGIQDDRLVYISEVERVPIPITIPEEVKSFDCSMFACIILTKSDTIYALNGASTIAEKLFSVSNEWGLKGIKMVPLDQIQAELLITPTIIAFSDTKLYGWGINRYKLLSSDTEYKIIDEITELSYSTNLIAKIGIGYQYKILDVSVSKFNAHVLVEVAKWNLLNLLFLLLCLFLPVILLIIVIIIVSAVLISRMYYKNQKQHRYSRLLTGEDEVELDTFSEVDVPLMSVDFEVFKIDINSIDIKSEIGSGGSGAIVYKAKMHHEWVAIKIFRTKAVAATNSDWEEFKHEIDILTHLRHPNIVLFYGTTLSKNRIGIVFEYCSNGNLSMYMQKESISFDKKVELLKQLAKALAFLHSKQIIHRDVKLENILIDTNGTVKLTDFGLSKMIQEKSSQNMTKGVGTDHLIAPEVILGQEYDVSVDVFSFGIVMMELLIEKVNPYLDEINYSNGNYPASGIAIRVALDPTFRPRPPPNFEIQPFHRFYLLLMQDCWRHEAKERPTMLQVLERLENK